jgi:hypothetical protein
LPDRSTVRALHIVGIDFESRPGVDLGAVGEKKKILVL